MLFGWEITQMKIVIICFLDNYTYATPDVDATVAASLLILHNNVHINANASSSKPKPPNMDILILGEIVIKRFGIHFGKNV